MALRFEALLRAHGFMRTERPPEIWVADTDARVLPLLGELIAAALSGGGTLGELTLAVSNVVVEADVECPPGEIQSPAPGEYVAMTVKGETDLGPDAKWPDGALPAVHLLRRLDERFTVAGARFAYVRRIPPEGSVTVFLPRLG
ncbi:MAG: hypothetical protein HOP28_15030 [Gemmatimonadales bacterium]|nr:hypothetical protein [Gemmatimonadales bacterium]